MQAYIVLQELKLQMFKYFISELLNVNLQALSQKLLQQHIQLLAKWHIKSADWLKCAVIDQDL